MRPAMVVLGLAVIIVGVLVLIGFLTPQAPAPPRQSTVSATVPSGVPSHARPAGLLSPIVVAGAPPTNVRDAVILPDGSVRVAYQDNTPGAGTRRPGPSAPVTQAAALGFFASAMKVQGWQVFDQGPATNHPGAFEVLGKLAGSDGYFWEMGAIVPPTSFSAGGPSRGQTDITIRLVQESD